MLRFFEGCRPELGMLRNHARILPGGCCAVLHESSAIGTFLLNSSGKKKPFSRPGGTTVGATLFGEEAVYRDGQTNTASPRGEAQRLSNSRDVFFRISANLKFSLPPTGQTWGHASQPTEVPSEVALVGEPDGQCDLGQRQLECHGASVRRVRGGAVANIHAAAFPRIDGRPVRNDARKALPSQRDRRGLPSRRRCASMYAHMRRVSVGERPPLLGGVELPASAGCPAC